MIGGGQPVVRPAAAPPRRASRATNPYPRSRRSRIRLGSAFASRVEPSSGLDPQGMRTIAPGRSARRTRRTAVAEVVPLDVPFHPNVSTVAPIGTSPAAFTARIVPGSRSRDGKRDQGQGSRPVMLKRGMNATYEEWLMAAEYILASGNPNVMLCERGVRSFETYTRNLFDVAAIPAVHELSHLPVIADPSHGSGRWRMVEPLALAAVAAGADGLLVEVHPNPARALSDGAQSLTPDHFSRLMTAVTALRRALIGQETIAPKA